MTNYERSLCLVVIDINYISRFFVPWQLMCTNQRKERAELLQELLKNGAGMDPLPVLTQETLIIWGDKDQVFPVDLGHRLHR